VASNFREKKKERKEGRKVGRKKGIKKERQPTIRAKMQFLKSSSIFYILPFCIIFKHSFFSQTHTITIHIMF
jgi:hypothetical protein